MTNQPSTVGSLSQMLNSAGGAGTPFFRLKENERRVVRFLLPAEEGVAALAHSVRVGSRFVGVFTCLGTPECPGCQRGDNPGFKGWLPVFDVKEQRAMILSGGRRLFEAIMRLHEAHGDITFRDAVVSRKGTSFDTRYATVPAVTREEYGALLQKYPSGETVDDPAEVLLSRHVHIEPVVFKWTPVLEQLGITPGENASKEARAKLLELISADAAPPSVAKAEAMYSGQILNEDAAGVTEDVTAGDFIG